MKTFIYSLLVLIVFFVIGSCNKKDSVGFKTVDYSCFWGPLQSIKVQDNGMTFINITTDHSERYYYLMLDIAQMDTISTMLEEIYALELDTIITIEKSNHPVSFCLLVDAKGRKLMTSFHGDLYSEKELYPLFKLADFLGELSNKVQMESKSSFEFKSRNKLILPPPPQNEK